MKNNYDIVIIGGGLVGVTLAAALANTNLQIAVIEASPVRELNLEDPDSRSIVLSYTSEKIFKTLNIWPNLGKYLTPINSIHISDRGHFGTTRIQATDYCWTAIGYAVSTVALAKILLQHAIAKNIHWIQPATVTAISDHKITVNNQELSAKLIVAADGANSKMRELLGIKVEITDYDQSAVVANISLDRDHQGIAYERFTVDGPIALIPFEERMTLVWTTTHQSAQQLLQLNDAELLAKLQTAFGYRAGKFIAATKRMVYPLNLTVSEQQHLGNILILGNAAHSVHPVSAQGFNLSLRDVAQLAEDILAIENLDNTAILERYLQNRHADQQATIQYTDDLIRVFSTDAFPITPLRGIGLSKLNNLPWLKKIIVRRAAGLRGKASKLLRGIKLLQNDIND